MYTALLSVFIHRMLKGIQRGKSGYALALYFFQNHGIRPYFVLRIKKKGNVFQFKYVYLPAKKHTYSLFKGSKQNIGLMNSRQ